jgi:hypothetical protein
MITNIFHKKRDLIGINIERRNDESFIVSVAYTAKNKTQVKTLSGVSGDIDDEKLIDEVLKRGHSMDKITDSTMFSNSSLDIED